MSLPHQIGRRNLCALGAGLMLWPLAAGAAPPAPELEAYERRTGGRIGVYAENLKSGRKIAWRADERFVMCSSFKASLAACVLRRVDRGQERLDRAIAYGAADLLGNAPVARENLAKGALSVERMCRPADAVEQLVGAGVVADLDGGPAHRAAWCWEMCSRPPRARG